MRDHTTRVGRSVIKNAIRQKQTQTHIPICETGGQIYEKQTIGSKVEQSSQG